MTNDIAINVENLSKVYPLLQSYVAENGQLTNKHWILKVASSLNLDSNITIFESTPKSKISIKIDAE